MVRSQTVTVQGSKPVELKSGDYDLVFHLPEFVTPLAEAVAWFTENINAITGCRFISVKVVKRVKETLPEEPLWSSNPLITYIEQSHTDLIVVFAVRSPVAIETIAALALLAIIVVGVFFIVITLSPHVAGLGIGLLILVVLFMMGVRMPERREERG